MPVCAMTRQRKRSASLRLAAHTLDTSAMFVVFAISAVVLNLTVKQCGLWGAPQVVVRVLTLMEYTILAIEGLVLMYCLVRDAWNFLKETS